MKTGVIAYLIIMNIVGFAAMGIDKAKARNRAWRTPEFVLFAIAALGGSIGCIAGMNFFHHKTKHKTFTIGMPLIFVAQAAIIALILYFSK